MRGEAYTSLKNALEVLLSRTSLDLGPRVSHHTSKHPIEIPKLSPLLCSMRVDLTKTVSQQASAGRAPARPLVSGRRSEEHTSELQSLRHLVCRLLLEKKNKKKNQV